MPSCEVSYKCDPAINELVKTLIRALAEKQEWVVLTVSFEARGETVRLGRTIGPRGYVHCVQHGKTVARFNVDKAMKFLVKTGMLTILGANECQTGC